MLKQTVCSREAPLLPAILRFSIPLMLTGILQLAYNTADSIIVGRYAGVLGAHASLAAVGSTTSIIFLIITLFNGVSIGANYMAARDFGAQDDRGLFRTVHCAALLSVILGLLACMCGLLLSTPLLRWADAPEDVLPLSVLYLRIYFLGVPALVVYNFGSALLRAVWRYTVFEAVGTVESMYWSYPVSWLLTFLIHLIYLERDRRRLMVENTAAR